MLDRYFKTMRGYGNVPEGATLGCEVAIFTAEIASLARLLLARVAKRGFTTLVRVQVSASASAISISGYGLFVDVVHCNLVSSGQLTT